MRNVRYFYRSFQQNLFIEELKKKTQIFMLSSTLDPNDIKRATENFYVKKLFSKPLAVSEFKEIITLQ